MTVSWSAATPEPGSGLDSVVEALRGSVGVKRRCLVVQTR